MPRPNRYHPYARPQAQSQGQISSRYNPTRSSHRTPPPISAAEQPPMTQYQPIFPGYIRGITSDGKALVARSILQAPDGMFYIQMEMIRYPSEDIKPRPHSPPPTQMYPTQLQSLAMPSPLILDPFFAGLDIERLSSPDGSRRSSTDTFSGPGSSVGDECAVLTDDDDDIDGESEPDDAHTIAVLEQQRIMLELMQQRIAAAGNA